MSARNTYEKNLDEIKKELIELKKSGEEQVIFPCNVDIRLDLVNILQFAKNLGFKVILETNARMFSYKELCEKTKHLVDEFIPFIWSYSSEEHNSLTRVPNRYHQTNEGINNIRELGIPVSVKYVQKGNNNVITHEEGSRLYHDSYKFEILIFVNMSLGGAGVYVSNMIKYLSKNFDFSIILHRKEIHPVYYETFREHNVNLSYIGDVKNSIKLINKADLIYFVGAGSIVRYFHVYPKEVIDVLKKKKNRMLLINDPISDELFDLLDGNLYDYFDILSFPCKYFMDKNLKVFDPENILKHNVIYHPVFEKKVISRKYVNNKEIVIGRLSRDTDEKFSEDTIEFYNELASEDIKFVFLGGKKTIIKKLGNAKVPDNWILYEEGEISREEFFGMIDIFVYKTAKTYDEYFAHVIPEAMYFGVPVVTEDRDAYKEQISDGKTGFLCKNNKDFYQKIQDLISDPGLRKLIGENAQKFIIENFNVDEFTLEHTLKFMDIIFKYTFNQVEQNRDLYNYYVKKIKLRINEYKKKPAIVYLMPNFIREHESYIFNEINNIEKYQKIVLCKALGNPEKILNSDIQAFVIPWRRGLNFDQEALKVLDSEKIKLIHCEFGFDANMGLILSEKFNVPLIVSFKGYDAYGLPKKEASYYNELFNSNVTILVPSEHMEKHLIELGCPPKKILFHTFGSDTSKFKFVERKVDDKIRFLFVGRLIGLKGLEYALHAFKKLKNKYSNVEFRIIGDGELKETLINLRNDLGLKNHIKFIFDFVSHERVFQEMSKAHIFLHPSVVDYQNRTEGVPNSVIEAMATGMPVISTYHGGIPELIEDGKNGFLVKEQDVNGIYEKMEYLVENQQIWKKIGLNARKKVLEKHDLRKQERKLEKIYNKIITEHI